MGLTTTPAQPGGVPTGPAGEVDEAVARVEAFLRDHLPPAWVAAIDDGDADALAAARPQLDLDRWWVSLADVGYVTPTWPRAYGGLDASPAVGSAVARTLGRYKVPRFTNPVGVDMAGPAIIRWGTDLQKQRLLRPIARHQEIWCQLFSEPGAGSDLAGLSTRAERHGDTWVVTGQKVWTSLAHVASFGLLLARTAPELPKHQGLSMFLVPMDQPGVTVRPLRHMAGDVEFDQVFLDGALVDDAWRLGEVNGGWRVAVSVLLDERQGASGGGAALPGTATGRSVASLLRRHGRVADPILRQRLAQAYIEDRVVQLTNQRSAARRRAGQGAGPGASITKLSYTEHVQRLQELASDLEGPAGQAWPAEDRWLRNTAWSFLRVRSKTIAGGTSEVQRNAVGERVLGLPKEPEVDRGIPWSEVGHR